MHEKPSNDEPAKPVKSSSLAFSVSWILASPSLPKPAPNQPQPAILNPFHLPVFHPTADTSNEDDSKEEEDDDDEMDSNDDSDEDGKSGRNLGVAPAWQSLWQERLGFPGRRIGHPYQTRAPAKHKKPRTSFGKEQVKELEKRFKDQKYLASTERAALAKSLRMSDAQVKTWFQNRRTKWRRQAAEEKEQERQVACRIIQSSPYLASHYAPQPSYFARPDVAI